MPNFNADSNFDKSFLQNIDSHIDDTWRSYETVYINEGKKWKNGKRTNENNPQLPGSKSLLSSLSIISINKSTTDMTGRRDDMLVNEMDYFTQSGDIATSSIASARRNPTGTNIVNSFNEDTVNHAMQYKEADFIFLDDYKSVPNNYMITLRRFANPCGDNLLSNLENPQRDVSRMITYMTGDYNKLDEILGFSVGYNWKEFKSEVQTIERSKTTWQHPGLNTIAGYLDGSGRFNKEKLMGEDWTNFDPYEKHHDQYTWGPMDVIDSIQARDKGLTFSHDLKVEFRYRVRSFYGINTRAAFLDILGNILNMTYSKAPFWGGAVRMTGGGGYASPIGDFSKLASGDTVGFISSFMNDLKNTFTAPFSGGFLNALNNIGKTLGGNFLGSIVGQGLDKLQRPELYSLHSLLTAQNTGEWHLTIGNPYSPVLMIGNLALKDSTISFEGPFTIDDVPSVIKVECKLEHCLPRDKYAIQKMFNLGAGRFYSSDSDFSKKTYYRNRSLNSGPAGGGMSAKQNFNNATDTIKSVGSVFQDNVVAVKII